MKRPAFAIAVVIVAVASARIGNGAGPGDAHGASDAACIHMEEQVAGLIASYGKPAIVLEGAFQRNGCSRHVDWTIDQSRIASTRSHIIIFGLNDDIPAFLERSKQNAAVIERNLPPDVLKKSVSTEASAGGLPFKSLDNLLEQCMLPIAYPASAAGSLWAASHRVSLAASASVPPTIFRSMAFR